MRTPLPLLCFPEPQARRSNQNTDPDDLWHADLILNWDYTIYIFYSFKKNSFFSFPELLVFIFVEFWQFLLGFSSPPTCIYWKYKSQLKLTQKTSQFYKKWIHKSSFTQCSLFQKILCFHKGIFWKNIKFISPSDWFSCGKRWHSSSVLVPSSWAAILCTVWLERGQTLNWEVFTVGFHLQEGNNGGLAPTLGSLSTLPGSPVN